MINDVARAKLSKLRSEYGDRARTYGRFMQRFHNHGEPFDLREGEYVHMNVASPTLVTPGFLQLHSLPGCCNVERWRVFTVEEMRAKLTERRVESLQRRGPVQPYRDDCWRALWTHVDLRLDGERRTCGTMHAVWSQNREFLCVATHRITLEEADHWGWVELLPEGKRHP